MPGRPYINPNSIDFGNVVVGQHSDVSVLVQCVGGGTIEIDDIILSHNGIWVLSGLPSFQIVLEPLQSFNFTISFYPIALTGYGSDIIVSWSYLWENEFKSGPAMTIVLAGTGASATPCIVVPSTLSFAPIEIFKNETLTLQIQSQDVTPFNVTALAFTTGTQFSLVSPPALPFVMNNGDAVTLTVKFAPSLLGAQTDILTVTTDTAGSPTCSISGFSNQVTPIDIIMNNVRGLVVGGIGNAGPASKPAPLQISPTNYDSDQPGQLAFNGPIWESIGAEKTMTKLGIYYENLGPAIVGITLAVFRPSQGPDYVQSYFGSANLGTAAADGLTHYAEIDINATGELVFMYLNRAASSGPLSICAIVPYFEPRGEKVRNV